MGGEAGQTSVDGFESAVGVGGGCGAEPPRRRAWLRRLDLVGHPVGRPAPRDGELRAEGAGRRHPGPESLFENPGGSVRRVVGPSRSTRQYRPAPKNDAAVVGRMKELASESRQQAMHPGEAAGADMNRYPE